MVCGGNSLNRAKKREAAVPTSAANVPNELQEGGEKKIAAPE